MRKLLFLLPAIAMLMAGCTADPYTGENKLSNTAIGAGGGALVGGVAGALIGKGGKGKRNAALIGAGVGALAGGGIGLYMDKQEADLRTRLRASGVSVTRNTDDSITLNMPNSITFNTDSDQLRPQLGETLASVAVVLKKYDQTTVSVAGFTDSDGAADYNLALSERRAQAVAAVLANDGISQNRLDVRGFGKAQPIASNTSAEGKAQNRRVEIRIIPAG